MKAGEMLISFGGQPLNMNLATSLQTKKYLYNKGETGDAPIGHRLPLFAPAKIATSMMSER